MKPTVLLDEVIPEFDFSNQHATAIAAPPAAVAEAIRRFRLEADGSRLVRLLFRLRGLRSLRGPLRAAMTTRGFRVLAEKPDEEVVLGIAGRFWALRELKNLVTLSDAEAFRNFREPGAAKAAMNLRYTRSSDGGTRLTTETRVQCVDRAAYRRFRLYWIVIKPFSGWIRRDVLRAIARLASADLQASPRGQA